MAGSSTQIGSAAIVLSANADKLTAGLSKSKADVEKWAGGVAKSTDRAAKAAGGDGKGGFLGKLLGVGGSFAGGFAGAFTAAGIGKFFQLLHDLPELTARLGEKSTGSDTGALQSIAQGFVRIQDAVDELMTRGLALLAPAFGAVLDAATAFGGRTGPIFAKVGEALSVIDRKSVV